MDGFFRKIAIYLCKPIYCLIVYMYKIFYNIAKTRFLKSDVVQQISANIYTLVSVVMLFAFSITILSAIVNPDLLSDGKKGVKAIFKRAIIALMLIVVIPFAFNELYTIQDTIMTNSLIEKIVVGIEYNCNNSDESKCEAGGNGGQVIAGTLMSAVLRPDEEMADADGNVNVSVSVSEYYQKMIAEDLPKNIGGVAKNINATAINPQNDVISDDAYAFRFDWLIAIVVGLATVYILVLFAIDVAVRVFKLAFLELTAPISIVSYVAAGDKILSSWFKELGKTYAELFIRVAAIAFYLFLVNNLSSFMDQFKNPSWSFVLKAFLMVGMLIFVKQIPDMIGKIFGVEMKSQGGIAGRLGSMAGVGNVAKKAWEAVRNPIAATAGVVSAGGALVSRFNAIRNNANERADRLREAGAGRGRMIADRVLTYGGGLLTMPASSVRAFRNGVVNKNLHAIGEEAHRYEDMHPEGSTFGGRVLDTLAQTVGARTRIENQNRELERRQKIVEARELDIKDREDEINDRGYTITIGNNTRTLTKEQMEFEKKNRTSFNDAIAHSIEKENSQVKTTINGVTGNYHQLSEYISSLRQNGPSLPDKSNYEREDFDEAAYNQAFYSAIQNGTTPPDRSSFTKTSFDQSAYDAAVKQAEKQHFDEINAMQKDLADFRKDQMRSISATFVSTGASVYVDGEDAANAMAAKDSLDSYGINLSTNYDDLKAFNNSIISEESRRNAEINNLAPEKTQVNRDKSDIEHEKREREVVHGANGTRRVDYTEYGHRTQDNNAVNARNNNGSSSSSSKK